MPPQLPIITFKHDELPDWRREYEPTNGIHIIIDNKTDKPVLAVHADTTATMIMALPKLLAFFMLFGLNHPVRIPLNTLLDSCNIKLLRKGEENAKPQKSDSLAE